MDDGSVWLLQAVSKLGPLPVNYLVFDVESTGLDLKNDLVVQLGYAVVINKKLVDCSHYIPDWTSGKDKHFCDWLENRMLTTKNSMESRNQGQGPMYKHSTHRMKAEGVPVAEAFTNFMDIIKICKANRFSLIAHNGLKFDQPILNNNIKQVLGEHESFEFEKMGVGYFDTMAMERGLYSRIAPYPEDDWMSFTGRLVKEGGRIYSSLDRHCSNKYNLINKHSMSGSAHEADFDCRLTHHLFEEYREMCEKAQQNIIKEIK